MARQNINTGAAANDKTGDPLRTAFIKVNANFTELYANVATISSNISEPVDYADILNAPTDISDLTDTTDLLSPPPPSSLINGDNEVELDALGTLNVPYQSTNNTFQLTLSTSNYVPTIAKPTLPLVGPAWVFNASFSYESDGQFTLNITNSPLPAASNPGYSTGDVFTFNSTVHNITGYILSVTLDDVLENTVSMVWTADLIVSSPLPVYPSTIDSLGVIKLTAANNDLILGTDGSLTLPYGRPLLFGNGNSRIQAGEGFHVNSEEGISIEAVDAEDPLNPITKYWNFSTDGFLTLPDEGRLIQNNSYTMTTTAYVAANSDVIWTSHSTLTSGAKLFIQVEANEVGDNSGWHSQVCEVFVSARGYAISVPGPIGQPAFNVTGVSYTSDNQLMTFTAQRNNTTDLIEVIGVATNSLDGAAHIRIHSIETLTSN